MDKDAIGTIVTEFSDPPNIDSGAPHSGDDGIRSDADPARINGYATVEPGTGGSDSSRRTGRRGRPPGSKNGSGTGKTGKTPESNLSSLESILLSIHGLLAAFVAPEFDLTTEEGRKLAGAVGRMSKLYDDKFNPKAVAWVDLLSTCGMIYGPRIITLRMRMAMEGQNNQPKQPVPINSVPRAKVAGENRTAPRSPAEMFGDFYSGADIVGNE